MEIFEFIKWCFKDESSGVVSLIILSGLSYFFIKVIAILRGVTYEDCDCDESDTIQDLIDDCNEQIVICEGKKETYADDPDQVKAFDSIIDKYNFMILRLSKHL